MVLSSMLLVVSKAFPAVFWEGTSQMVQCSSKKREVFHSQHNFFLLPGVANGSWTGAGRNGRPAFPLLSVRFVLSMLIQIPTVFLFNP